MSTPCEKHALLPVVGHSPCAGCEIERLRAENEALLKDAERLNWLDKRSVPVVEGQCWSQPEGELWGYDWGVAGQCSTVREAIDYAMSKDPLANPGQ